MLIVRTKDNKMLQDTVAGVILQPYRPTLVENTTFVEQRAVKNEYRPAEVEVLVSNFDPNEGVSDKTLEIDWNEYTKTLGPKDKVEMDKFVSSWVKSNGTKGKETAAVSDPKDANKSNKTGGNDGKKEA